MRLSLPTALLAASLCVAGGCASTKVTNTWEAPAAERVPFNRVLVVAEVGSEPVRRQLEDELSSQLRTKGVNATQSYRLVDRGEALDRSRLESIATTNDFDGVLVARYLLSEIQLNVDRGVTYLDYYDFMWPDVHGRGQIDSFQSVKAESRLFSVRDGGKLVWTATAETYDPGSEKAATAKLARKFVSKMDEDLGI